jgi:hypothetical protein
MVGIVEEEGEEGTRVVVLPQDTLCRANSPAFAGFLVVVKLP